MSGLCVNRALTDWVKIKGSVLGKPRPMDRPAHLAVVRFCLVGIHRRRVRDTTLAAAQASQSAELVVGSGTNRISGCKAAKSIVFLHTIQRPLRDSCRRAQLFVFGGGKRLCRTLQARIPNGMGC